MLRRLLVCGALAFTIAVDVPRATAQDAQAAIKAAQYALGMIRGPRRIAAVATLEYWGEGSVDGMKANYHASLSYIVPAMRVDILRENPNGREIHVVSGAFAWDESVPGAGFMKNTTATPVPKALKARLLELWTTPFGALKAAERAGANAKAGKEGGATIIRFPFSGGLAGISATVVLNAKNEVERVATQGDPELSSETSYSEYKDLGEIKSDVPFPTRITRRQGGRTALDLTITKTDPNNPYVVFPVPENIEKSASR